MSYTALYRKFRPSTFDEVKGQDPIVKTMKNQIKADRIGHAYLFCGTRGTGKTSVAKIFAKAVNCEHPVDGSPCGECASCRAIAAGTSMNVIEIDAASNNGVDNIREIREEVAYSPAEGRYKVYIIDEVHMLSTGAFNALLKTLEEPPSYVIFILATTEAHKIPVTILSRCQRYDFRRISQDTILARLTELTDAEQVEAEEKALRYIARKGDGSMRDSLSLLDQCISFYLGEKLTYDRVLEVLGAVDTDVFSNLLRKILRGEVAGTIRTLERLIMEGSDLTQFVNDFTWYLRNLMLLKSSDDMEEVLDVSSENLVQLREEAAMVRSDTLIRYIRIFSELANAIRNATNKRVLVEMALIKLCKPETESDELSLLERVRKLERAMEQGAVYAAQAGAGGAYGMPGAAGAPGGAYGMSGAMGAPGGAYGMPGAAGAPGGMYGVPGQAGGAYGTADQVGEPDGRYEASGSMSASVGAAGPSAAALPRAVPEDLKKVCEMWKSIIGGAAMPFRAALASAVPNYNSQDESDERLYVVFSDFLAERYLNSSEHKAELEQLIADRIGKQVEVKFVLAADQGIQRGTLSRIDIDEQVKEQVRMEVEIIEDET
ncbi:MAG: DNA polymerase III subunit gamma/tau [Lachnospiraceae bacterium]|nr:DNA polymerase III subunit gamma/tau [Lachnospiraceae bacterium]